MDDFKDIVALISIPVGITLIVLALVLGLGYGLFAVNEYAVCSQLEQAQPELQPQMLLPAGCMIVNPYTGYLQEHDDWSENQSLYLYMDSTSK
jgi:hypothetical protein